MVSTELLSQPRRSFLRHAYQTVGAMGTAVCMPAWSAQPPFGGRTRVTVAVARPHSMAHLPLLLAQNLGYFEAEGLQVELVAHATEVHAVLAALKGNVAVVACSYVHALMPMARLAELQAFLLHSRSPQVVLGASLKTLGHYRSAVDLRGQRVGVLASDASAPMVLGMVLHNAGVQPSEASLVVAQDAAELIARYRAGDIDALSLNDPTVTMLEQRGEIRVLADTRSVHGTREVMGGPVPGYALCAPQAWVGNQAAVCQALANGVVHALKWLQTAGPGDLLKALPDVASGSERALYLAAFDKARDGFSPDGLLPPEAARAALAVQLRLESVLRDARVNLMRTFTNQFAQKAKSRFRA
jgi:NitT/TauT family transport system substrate-binding protein